MLNIRPVSDLRNRFSEVEEDVLSKGEPVFLTKNGYGSMVLLSLEQYEKLTNDVELALDEADRDHFLVVAAHQPEGMPMDPYWCSEGISLKSKMKVGVYPTWSYNFEDLVVGIGAGAISKTSIRQQISHAEKTYPAVCGVKATSTLEGSTAKIEATVQFQQAGNYKIACVLVENNIENKETYNTFDHVLRAAQTDMEGDAVTPAVTAPEERTFNFEATIEEGWNAENCAFVVYVFKEEANGKYIVNNGAECAVDGSVDYRYEL